VRAGWRPASCSHPPLPAPSPRAAIARTTPSPRQVITPGAQRRRIHAWHKHALRFHAVRSFSFAAQRFGGLLDADGCVRREATDKLFHKFRKDE
jgi:hypothetical protein